MKESKNRHVDSPPYKQLSVEEVRVRSPTQQDTLTRGIKVRVSADVRVGEPGSNGSYDITGVFVRKVINLAFEKNLMRANAVDFKNCIVGVVDFDRSSFYCSYRNKVNPYMGPPEGLRNCCPPDHTSHSVEGVMISK